MSGKFLKLFALLLLVSALFVACEKDDIVPIEGFPTEQDNSQLDLLAKNDTSDCYVITFPLTFVYEDGTTATAEDEDDLLDILSTAPYPVDIEYPIFLTDPASGETLIANNEEELADLLEACEDFDDDWDDDAYCYDTDIDEGSLLCYNFIFPISFELIDGSTATAESESDLEDIFFSSNPPVDFAYPIQLEHAASGATHTVASAEELGLLLDDC